MSEPFENKYKQLKLRHTEQKIRISELRNINDKLLKEVSSMYSQLVLAHNILIKAGYRRVTDMSWTNQPYSPSEEVENE